MVDKRRGCNPRIVEQVTLYAHLRTLSSDLASSEAQSSSLDRSSSALKKTLRAPFHVLWNVRRPVRASDGKGTDLPESEFVSDSGTTSWTTKLHMPDLRRYRPFWIRLSQEEQEQLRKEWGKSKDWCPPNGHLVSILADLCDETYLEKSLTKGDWHDPMEEDDKTTNALCRLFLAKGSRRAMTIVFNDEDVYQFLEPMKAGSTCDVGLAKRDPHHNDLGDQYKLARECGGLHFKVCENDTKRRCRPTGDAFSKAVAHILKPYKGGREHHKDTAAEQKRAGFDWAEICELLDKHNLWPERWTSVIKTAVKQKTLGRMATPAKAKLATNSMFEWRQSILDTFWDENEDLGVLRRQIWEENFDWTTAGVDFERPFRFPPSPPSSQRACVCVSVSLPV